MHPPSQPTEPPRPTGVCPYSFPPAHPAIRGYRFSQGADSINGDIMQAFGTPLELAAICNGEPGCLGACISGTSLQCLGLGNPGGLGDGLGSSSAPPHL
jgi:hypothetical protein